MARFVLLEHRWNGTHWDLMLEADGVLRTWALAEPPAPGAEVPARALPEHRLAYLEYEGPVSGGRGTVRRVDGGTYQVEDWEPDRVRVRLAGAQLIGVVDLRRIECRGEAETPLAWTLRFGNAD